MNAEILAAIASKRRLTFIYNGRRRTVEPQCHGLGTKGTELLRAYQLTGGGPSEPLFDVAKMSELRLLDEHFERPGPHFKRGDSAMREIYAEL